MAEAGEVTNGFEALAPAAPKYLNISGKLTPWADATVHITQVGWTAISAVFEGIRAYWNADEEKLYIFQLDAHLRRLANSMKLMRMVPPLTPAEVGRSLVELLRFNELREDSYMQPLAFFSGAVPGYRAVEVPTTEILLTARPNASCLLTGRVNHCCISTWVRLSDNSMPPRVKALANYQNSRLVATEARVNNYDAGIILNSQGKVCEGGAACIYIIRDGVAITPPVTAGILESITRLVVKELLERELGVATIEREVDRTELYIADEVFFCGTMAEITPIVSVDRFDIGEGRVGPITARVEKLYHDIVRGIDKRYERWLTEV
ncbi:MAG: branched-chain-amino-acid transaminase [Dehalococcoidia bacterium]|nr:branched-chain-amino-acid transaminase [Dehalococcoidia bacterium]